MEGGESVITYINGYKQKMTKGELQNIISQRKFDFLSSSKPIKGRASLFLPKGQFS